MEMEQIVTPEVISSFEQNGFAVIRDFLDATEIQNFQKAITLCVENCIDDVPLSSGFSHAGVNVQYVKDRYFIESGDKIRGFLEEKALDANGELVVPKEEALNRLGHGLHLLDPTFRSLTKFSDKVKAVIRQLSTIRTPTVIKMKPHRDSTYLYSEPTEGSVLGFWIALDETNEENGCVQLVPGSHKINPRDITRFVRNPDATDENLFIYTGVPILHIPKEAWIPAICKPGDLLVFDGLTIHKSEANMSGKRRLACTLHFYDGNTTWSPKNWIQQTAANNFVKISKIEQLEKSYN